VGAVACDANGNLAAATSTGGMTNKKCGRFGRLAEAVARFPELIGIGLAEDTGLVIKENTFEVIGSGMVIVFDARKAKHNNHKTVENRTPMSLTNLKTNILASGDRFNIKKKKVKVSPNGISVTDAQFL